MDSFQQYQFATSANLHYQPPQWPSQPQPQWQPQPQPQPKVQRELEMPRFGSGWLIPEDPDQFSIKIVPPPPSNRPQRGHSFIQWQPQMPKFGSGWMLPLEPEQIPNMRTQPQVQRAPAARQWGTTPTLPLGFDQLGFGVPQQGLRQPFLQQTLPFGVMPQGLQQPFPQPLPFGGLSQGLQQPLFRTPQHGGLPQGYEQSFPQTFQYGVPPQGLNQPYQQPLSYGGLPQEGTDFQDLFNLDLTDFEVDPPLPEATTNTEAAKNPPRAPLATEIITIEDDDDDFGAVVSPACTAMGDQIQSLHPPTLGAERILSEQGPQQQRSPHQRHQKRKSLLELGWYKPTEPAIVTAALHPDLKTTFEGRRYLEQSDREYSVRTHDAFIARKALKRKASQEQDDHNQQSSKKIKISDQTNTVAPEDVERSKMDRGAEAIDFVAVQEEMALEDGDRSEMDLDAAAADFMAAWAESAPEDVERSEMDRGADAIDFVAVQEETALEDGERSETDLDTAAAEFLAAWDEMTPQESEEEKEESGSETGSNLSELFAYTPRSEAAAEQETESVNDSDLDVLDAQCESASETTSTPTPSAEDDDDDDDDDDNEAVDGMEWVQLEEENYELDEEGRLKRGANLGSFESDWSEEE